jgi:cytochrome P450 family 4 subfamily V
MEEKVILANLMRYFEITSLKTTEELNPIGDLIVRPLNGIPLEIKPRH